MTAPVRTRCSECSAPLDGVAHQVVTTRHGDQLPYCQRGCRRPTDLDRETSTVRLVPAPKPAYVPVPSLASIRECQRLAGEGAVVSYDYPASGHPVARVERAGVLVASCSGRDQCEAVERLTVALRRRARDESTDRALGGAA